MPGDYPHRKIRIRHRMICVGLLLIGAVLLTGAPRAAAQQQDDEEHILDWSFNRVRKTR